MKLYLGSTTMVIYSTEQSLKLFCQCRLCGLDINEISVFINNPHFKGKQMRNLCRLYEMKFICIFLIVYPVQNWYIIDYGFM